MHSLVDVLTAVGKHTELQVNPDGSSILSLIYGGRVLGLFAPHSEENFLWVHPSLQSSDAAQRFYSRDDWHNSGGDRTWLAPEVDIFFPDFPDTKTWRVPKGLDPGRYYASRTASGTLILTSEYTVALSRFGRQASGRITKSYECASNPLRHDPIADHLGNVEYAGYCQRTQLTLSNGADGPRVALWGLLAVPYGGEVFIPTYSRAEPRVFAGAISSEDLVVGEHLVHFKTQRPGIRKLAISAVCATGRVGYVYAAGENRVLVVRNVTVNPSGEYIDVPWNGTASDKDLVYSVQACSIDNALGSYCELEHHAPAIGCGTGRDVCSETSEVWAFRGSERTVLTIARKLLSPELDV